MQRKGLVVTLTFVILMAGSGWADTLELKDGTLVEGTYVGGTQNSLRFQVGDQVQTYAKGDILALTFTGVPAAPAAGAAAASATAKPPATPPAQPAPQAGATQPVPTAPAAIVVPAGTRLVVRMRDTLDSRRHKAGHMFTTALEMDLVINGKTVAKKGNLVYGKLVKAKKAGRLRGKSQMSVQMTDLMINNKPHRIMTTELTAATENTAKGTAKTVGAGAAVGGIAGGSKKAKRGAAIGLGVAFIGGGKQVQIPKGQLLQFDLTQPLKWAP